MKQGDSRILTAGYLWRHEIMVPRIMLAGQWLGKTGFHVGDKVNITFVKQEVLLIEKVEGSQERRSYT